MTVDKDASVLKNNLLFILNHATQKNDYFTTSKNLDQQTYILIAEYVT